MARARGLSIEEKIYKISRDEKMAKELIKLMRAVEELGYEFAIRDKTLYEDITHLYEERVPFYDIDILVTKYYKDVFPWEYDVVVSFTNYEDTLKKIKELMRG